MKLVIIAQLFLSTLSIASDPGLPPSNSGAAQVVVIGKPITVKQQFFSGKKEYTRQEIIKAFDDYTASRGQIKRPDFKTKYTAEIKISKVCKGAIFNDRLTFVWFDQTGVVSPHIPNRSSKIEGICYTGDVGSGAKHNHSVYWMDHTKTNLGIILKTKK